MIASSNFWLVSLAEEHFSPLGALSPLVGVAKAVVSEVEDIVRFTGSLVVVGGCRLWRDRGRFVEYFA